MNYLKHEIQVKYVDGLLAHSQNWQWLIDKLQEEFEIKEINSWSEYFVKILGICNREWMFSKKEFKEIWEIAKFYIGSLSVNDCINEISLNQSRTFFLCV